MVDLELFRRPNSSGLARKAGDCGVMRLYLKGRRGKQTSSRKLHAYIGRVAFKRNGIPPGRYFLGGRSSSNFKNAPKTADF